MNSHWWAALDLAKFESIYQQYPSCRSKLDKIINVRRQLLITTLPAQLNDEHESLFAKLPKISGFISALGLVYLGARDALCVGAIRRALASVLGDHGCDQLLAMNLKWPEKNSIALAIENISSLTQIGWQWLKNDASRDNHTSLLIQALDICFTPLSEMYQHQLQQTSHSLDPLFLLYKFARFL
jgi:hypothetical protein